MPEKLSQQQIHEVLRSNYIGRIGCSDTGKTYIVPITYYFDEATGSIISHSGEGMKIRMLRKNPQVCFEMEQIRDINDWDSVIAWGTYEELSGSDAKNELHNLVNRLRVLIKDPHPKAKFLSDISNSQITEGYHIIYRIRLAELTGRSQKPTKS